MASWQGRTRWSKPPLLGNAHEHGSAGLVGRERHRDELGRLRSAAHGYGARAVAAVTTPTLTRRTPQIAWKLEFNSNSFVEPSPRHPHAMQGVRTTWRVGVHVDHPAQDFAHTQSYLVLPRRAAQSFGRKQRVSDARKDAGSHGPRVHPRTR